MPVRFKNPLQNPHSRTVGNQLQAVPIVTVISLIFFGGIGWRLAFLQLQQGDANKLKAEHHPLDWKEIVSKTANMMLGLANGNKLKEEELIQINHKVVIGIGSLDKMVSFEESENASNLLPNGTLNKIEGFEHPIDKIDSSELVLFVREALEH